MDKYDYLVNKIDELEKKLNKEIRRFNHLYSIIEELDLTDSQRYRMNKAWWGSEDE